MAKEEHKTGNAVFEIRMKLGITQSQLAQKLDISDGYVYKLENGKKEITPKMMRKLQELERASSSSHSQYEENNSTGTSNGNTRELMAPYMDQAEKVVRLERELFEARQIINMQAKTIADQAASINRLTEENNLNKGAAPASGAGFGGKQKSDDTERKVE